MRDAFKSFRVNVAEEGEKPELVWRRYRDKNMRNRAKAYRRKRKVAGTAPEPTPRRMRYYRPIGRKGKVTRLERLQEEHAREMQRVQQMIAAQAHVHDENCNHDH
jgi:hypothetical protein